MATGEGTGVSNSLIATNSLQKGDKIVSSNGALELNMEADGDCVLTNNGQFLWHTDTAAHGSYAKVTTHGQLVICDMYDEQKWTSNPPQITDKNCKLVLLDDGNLVLFMGNGHPISESATSSSVVPKVMKHAA